MNAAIEKLKETVKGGNVDAIKADTDALQKAIYDVSAKLYQQSAPQQDPGAGQSGPEAGNNGGNGEYYDADFTDKTNN